MKHRGLTIKKLPNIVNIENQRIEAVLLVSELGHSLEIIKEAKDNQTDNKDINRNMDMSIELGDVKEIKQ